MSTLYRTTLTPGKPELTAAWLASRPWGGDQAEVLGAFRFDDPAGEVGVETYLLRTADGAVVQVPATFRGAPLEGAEQHLIGTAEHGVLGRRWVYDGAADPVYAQTLVAALLAGEPQAEEIFEVDGGQERREPSIVLRRVGAPPTAAPAVDDVRTSEDPPSIDIELGGLAITVPRHPSAAGDVTATALLGEVRATHEEFLLARVVQR